MVGKDMNVAARGVGILLLLGACGLFAAGAQTNAPAAKGVGCMPTAMNGCPAGGPAPSVSEQFPFPGEKPENKADAPEAPGVRAEGQDAKPVKDQFPYPGEKTDAAVPGSQGAKDRFPYPGEAPASGGDASGSSSSSSSGDAPVDPDAKPKLKDEGSTGDVGSHRRRLRPQAQKTLSDSERVDEDLSVAAFYQKSGNTLGAYLRAKDAVKLDPDASDTHLAVAQLADKLGKRDEAVAEYKAYLQMDPEGDGAKGARKALEKLKQ